MNPSLSHPFVSVLIRSYNRLPHVLEIVEICLRQNYRNYEIVVLEQSSDAHWEKHKESFHKLDRKLRMVRSKPLGPPGARNVGVAYCRGDVVLFMDDDDLPVGNDWILSHARHYVDPFCIGVSGRHVHELNERSRYNNKRKAYERCLTHSFFLRGWVFTGIDRVKKPVQWLHGNNASVRKSYVVKLGGWYPHVVSDHEEHSFYFKLQKAMRPGEYLMFDPEPKVLRRFDIEGGVGRRTMSLGLLLEHRLQYYHWVVSEYFPIRFYGLYPFFMLHAFHLSVRCFLGDSSFTDAFWIRVFGQKRGQYVYIFQEFVKFPFLVLRFLLEKKPKWNGKLPVVEGEQFPVRDTCAEEYGDS